MENKEITAVELLSRAEELIQKVHNFECQLMVSVTLTGKDNSIIENQVSNHSIIFRDKAMVDVATRFYGMDLRQTSYWMTEGEHYYEYSENPKGWVRNEYRQGQFLSYLESFYMLLNFPSFFRDKRSFEITGSEEINGKNYIILRGTVPGEASRPVLSLVTSLTLISILTDDDSFYQDIPDVPIHVYLDEETGELAKLVFSLKDVYEKIADNAFGSQPRPMNSIWGAVSTLTYINFQTAPDFQLPESARSHYADISPSGSAKQPLCHEETAAPAPEAVHCGACGEHEAGEPKDPNHCEHEHHHSGEGHECCHGHHHEDDHECCHDHHHGEG